MVGPVLALQLDRLMTHADDLLDSVGVGNLNAELDLRESDQLFVTSFHREIHLLTKNPSVVTMTVQVNREVVSERLIELALERLLNNPGSEARNAVRGFELALAVQTRDAVRGFGPGLVVAGRERDAALADLEQVEVLGARHLEQQDELRQEPRASFVGLEMPRIFRDATCRGLRRLLSNALLSRGDVEESCWWLSNIFTIGHG